MSNTRDERIAKSTAARVKRKSLKDTLLGKTERFYTRMRKLRKKNQKQMLKLTVYISLIM